MTCANFVFLKCVCRTSFRDDVLGKKTNFRMCVQNVSTHMHLCRYGQNVLFFENSDCVMAVREKLVCAISKYLKCVCETQFKEHVRAQNSKFGICTKVVHTKTGSFSDIAAMTGLNESSFGGKVCNKINISSP